MRQKIFRTFVELSIGILLAIGTAAFLIHQYFKTQDEVHYLENFGAVLASAINQEGWGFLERAAPRWLRITIIAPDGTVRFDSQVDALLLDNHSQRVEVKSLLDTALSIGQHEGEGTPLSVNINRFSQSLQRQTYYHALLLNSGEILRLSFTSNSLFLYTQHFTLFLTFVLMALIGGCYFLATKLVRSFMAPINAIELNKLHNFEDLSSSAQRLKSTYPELEPFLWRISMQQRKIDEQIDELRLKSNEFQAITKSMSDGLVLLNAKGNIVSINKTARSIFGVTKENCLNQSYLTIDNAQYLQEMMDNSSTAPKQTKAITRDGRDYEIRFSKISDNGTIVGYVLIILDVTEKKRTEQLRQEFTANVSHELKTPLQAIIGYSELMANGIVSPNDIPHFASRIHKQSTRLKTLIEDIIFLSHLDEGQVANLEHLDVKQICYEVFDDLQEKATEREVKLILQGEQLIITAVKRYIYELIYNLVDNAIRYNRPHGTVTVTLHSLTNKCTIAVSDSGIGIAPEEQHRIFERFYRVDKSHSRQTGGTGLGLSIVKRVVLYHYGKIKVASKLGQGTTFTVTLNYNKLQELAQTNERKQQALRERNQDIPQAPSTIRSAAELTPQTSTVQPQHSATTLAPEAAPSRTSAALPASDSVAATADNATAADKTPTAPAPDAAPSAATRAPAIADSAAPSVDQVSAAK